MEFYINSEKVEVSLESEKTIGDVLQSFAKTCEENNAAVIGICINGKKITSEMFDEESLNPLEKDTKFEFDVITEESLKASFSTLADLFENLALEIEAVPTNFISGNGKKANESITKLADSMEQFCHVMTLTSLFPNTFTEIQIGDKTFNDFFGNFSPILGDFEGALKNNDSVLIGDLCEYEICPRLKEISASLRKM